MYIIGHVHKPSHIREVGRTHTGNENFWEIHEICRHVAIIKSTC